MVTYGSVCSGIEAATVAWHPLGFKPLWLSEIEPFPSAVLEYHYPNVPNLGDMTQIAGQITEGLVEAPDILVGGTPCFTAGHSVLTDKGYTPIEQIKPGDLVVTHEGRLRRVVRTGSKVSTVGSLNGVGITEGIVCTPDHPFMSVAWRNQNTRRNGVYALVEAVGEPGWTKAEDMPGMQWCALTSYMVNASEFPSCAPVEEIMYLAGFYLGGGFIRRWAGKNKKAVVFGINDAKLVALKKNSSSFNLSVNAGRTGPRAVIYNTELSNWLITNFGEYSHLKTLPAWVLSHPFRRRLLSGYLDTDGHVRKTGWRANSTSRALAYGIRELSQTLGFVSSVSLVAVAPTKIIEGRTANQRNYWAVTAFSTSVSIKSRTRHGMLLRTVSNYSESGVGTVFNIEVEGDNSFILDGVVVHNCQAFSVAGLRSGLSDPRGKLTLSFVELADAIDRKRDTPSIIVWENVPGVLSSKDNAFGCLLAGLAGEDCELQPSGKRWTNAGCVFGPERTVAWRILDAQYFGVAQRRRRVFVVASARDGFDPAKVLFEFDSLRRDTPPSRKAGESFTHATAPCLTSSGRGVERTGDTRGQDPVIGVGRAGLMCMAHGQSGAEILKELSVTLTCAHEQPIVFGLLGRKPENGGNAVEPMVNVSTCLTGFDHNVVAFEPGIAKREGNPNRFSYEVSPTLRKEMGDNQVAVAFHSTGAGYWQEGSGTLRARPQDSHENLIAFHVEAQPDEMNFNTETTATLTTSQHAGVMQPDYQVRRLTPVECARLQGFPDTYLDIPFKGKPATDGHKYKALGNSMAVPVMSFIGEKINEALVEELI